METEHEVFGNTNFNHKKEKDLKNNLFLDSSEIFKPRAEFSIKYKNITHKMRIIYLKAHIY